ncbi:hypothetical protein ACFTAO_45190 [Paenibacillus rhizoplanae]
MDAEEGEAAKKMITEPIWRDLPAVKAGKVYFIDASLGVSTDPLVREKLVEVLPEIFEAVAVCTMQKYLNTEFIKWPKIL